MTSTATSPERRSGTLRTAGQARVALAALLAAVVIGLASLLTAPAASAAASLRPQQRVAASAHVGGPAVGPHEAVLPGQRRARAPSYDHPATGSSVAAEGGGDSSGFWQTMKDQWAARDDTGSIGGYGKSQVPSWVFNEGYAAEAGETPVQAATRIMNEQYGEGNWPKGPGTEFNQIVKWVSRTGGKP